MEEHKLSKAEAQPKKLSYEEVCKNFADLHLQYQKLTAQYQNLAQDHDQVLRALENRDFDYTSFFISMLFKVMDHTEEYEKSFVHWCAVRIEEFLRNFAAAASESGEERKNEAK